MEITEETIARDHPIAYWAMVGALFVMWAAVIVAGAAIYVGLGYEILHHLHVL